jgi:hypothetical protein
MAKWTALHAYFWCNTFEPWFAGSISGCKHHSDLPVQNLRARELCKLCRGNVCSVRKCSIYHLPTATATLAVIDDSVTISKSFFCEAEILREFAYFTRLLSFHFFSRVAFWCSFARTRAFGSAIPVQSTLNLRVNYNSHIIAPAHGWKMSTSDSHWGSTLWPKEDTHHLQGPNVFLLQKALESGGML